MKITVFGATGQTGKPLVGQDLANGYDVIAFVRDPSRLTIQHEHLSLVKGDITDFAAVERAVQGTDAVISVLNTQRDGASKPLTRGTKNILLAMKKFGVRRIILSSSAPSASDPNDSPDIRFKLFSGLIKGLVRSAYEDILGSVQAVQESDRDWTVVRMPLPTNAPITGRVNAGYVNKTMGMRISRADAAAFMLKEMRESNYLRHTPVISNY
jgi:UDP-glucose 4-epimerase